MTDIPSTTVTTIVGGLTTIFALIFICANFIVVKIMITDKNLFKHNSYKIMIAIGIADIGFSATHLTHGAFIFARYSPHEISFPFVGKLVDSASAFTYNSYVLLTALLAVNRFALTYSPSLERRLFSRRGMTIWLTTIELVAFAFFCSINTPYARLTLYWERLNPTYDFSLPYSYLVMHCASALQTSNMLLSIVLYVAVFVMLLQKSRNQSDRRAVYREFKILYQSIPFTAYFIVSRGVWYTSQWAIFEDTMAFNIVVIALRVGTGAVNPLIYYLSNVTLRRKIKKVAVAPTVGFTRDAQQYASSHGPNFTYPSTVELQTSKI